MRLCSFVVGGEGNPRFGLIVDDRVVDIARAGGPALLAEALQLTAAEMRDALLKLDTDADAIPLAEATLRAPIDLQEVWAAGVTYKRSRDARMEESTEEDVYERVYDADRPEIFFKATPNRVAGPGEPVAVRGDSGWDVPEPELVLLLNAHGEIVGYTIGNDVSSRAIEGDNPLYLPQAKLYSRSAALGPSIVTVDEIDNASNLSIDITIRRDGESRYSDATSTSRMHRTFDDLATYLFRCNEFPAGAFLMTGTGLVPPSDFTLEDGDEVTISIDRIGSLTNSVIRLPV
ncbi:MAG: fumarylacetoacetate hydrolase family protein [Thermomicrobiales bacterium]|nr:fumarylacetoacetate hydrolase family protein [Thermomicrobiales bacterium]